MRGKEHSRAVKKSLEYIEKNLKEKLSLSEVSRHIRFSSQHFYRIFNTAVGRSVADYIRRRRRAKAASELIYSKKRILDIALEYHFQSQEAFTRAFKKVYRLTPGQYRTYSRELVRGGHTMITDTALQGWTVTGQHTEGYKVSVDQAEVHTGKASAVLQSISLSATGFITLMQMFGAQNYLGKRLKLTAFVKGGNVGGWAGLWMRVDGNGGEMLKFDNMQNRPIKGNCEWNQYQVVLDIPQEAHGIAFGVLLSGPGKVWSDQFRFEVVDTRTPTTDEDEGEVLPPEPVNLDFEL